jgi:nitric oxide reductase activation protein
MNYHMTSGALYDAAMVLGETFEILDMPYEMRGFSNDSLQYKAMDDKTMDPARAAMLTRGPGGGTEMYTTAGLATTSLGGRKEKNRLFISLTDGALEDHMATAQQLAKAREQGITTFGIFLGAGVNAPRMDELYGRGNWTSINELKQMPLQVGSRIEKILKSVR